MVVQSDFMSYPPQHKVEADIVVSSINFFVNIVICDIPRVCRNSLRAILHFQWLLMIGNQIVLR